MRHSALESSSALGARLQVSYMERQGRQLVAVPYRGSVVSMRDADGFVALIGRALETR